ncbi:MAG: CAP domain-containing protein, partial [Miltoncostaeaceae bacterium]
VIIPRLLPFLAVALVAGLFASGGAAGAGEAPSESVAPGDQTCRLRVAAPREHLMVRLINRYRASARAGRLSLAPRIRSAGRRHSRWMARSGNFAHERVLKWARGRDSGQNLALGRSPRVVVRAMMRSRDHRANVLSRAYRSIGIGAVRDCRGTVFYTVNFLG